MTLLQSWRDSLTLLKPKNLQLFMLVTLKSIVETYKLLFKYWWWLYVLIGIVTYGILNINIKKYFDVYLLFTFLHFSFSCMALLVSYLAARQSVSQKNFAYFCSYGLHIPYLFICISALSICCYIPFIYDTTFFFVFNLEAVFFLGFSFMPFFFFDSSPSIKSLIYSVINSIKMILFNAPSCLLVSLLVVGFIFGVRVFGVYDFFITTLLVPVKVCLFSTIYIKKLHDQFDLYFPQPQEKGSI